MSDSVVNTILGSSIAVIGLMVAKEGKVSEFRQQWIDALREDVAKYCANALHVHGLPAKDSVEELRETNELSSRIRMRINPEKSNAKSLISAMAKLRAAVHARDPFEEVQAHVESVVSSNRVLIDEAWEKVKRGETRYRILLGVAIASLVISVTTAAYPAIPAVAKQIFQKQQNLQTLRTASSPCVQNQK